MIQLTDEDRGDVQGIVGSGYRHLDCAALLLLRVTDAPAAKAWLAALIPQVTTMAPWAPGPDGTKQRPVTVTNIAFTHAGLAALEVPAEALATFPGEFAGGMAARAAVLGDHGSSAPEHWAVGGAGDAEPHVMLMIGALDQPAVDAAVAATRASFTDAGLTELGLEHGIENATFTDHFGFNAAGVSQPTVEGLDGAGAVAAGTPAHDVIRTGEFILGYENELGLYPPSPGVDAANDPLGLLPRFPEGGMPDQRDLGRHGTYLVYRKLHMDVAGFWTFLRDAAADRVADDEAPDAAMARLGAKIVGRWPSGAPLALAPEADDPSLGQRNDFLFRETDEHGRACPIGSHIRRMNPRDSLHRIADTAEDSLRTSKQHRILRRGLVYGERLLPLDALQDGRVPVDIQDDGVDRGVQFLALNTDLARQFEFIQETWANNGKFEGFDNEKDPLIGDNDGTGVMTIPRDPIRERVHGIPRFVTVRGGGYFFLPSVTALRFFAS